MTSPSDYALGFLGITPRSTKPRTRGLSIVRDYGIGMHAAEDMCEVVGDFVDYVKIRHVFAMMATLDDNDLIMRKIRLYKAHNIHPFPGGIVFETAYLRGKVDETLAVICRMGCTAIELSDNFVDLSMEDRVKYTKQAVRCGLRVLSEFGPKYATEVFDADKTISECEAVLEAGATAIVVEQSELDLTIGSNGEDGPEAEKLLKLAEKLTLDHLIFEAEKPAQQKWLLRTLGPDVSLGPNLAPERIPFLEAIRRGLGRESGYGFVTDLMSKQDWTYSVALPKQSGMDAVGRA